MKGGSASIFWVFVALAAPAAGLAQAPRAQTPAEVLRAAQQSSGDVEQLRAALRSPDPSVRASTFAAMIDSNNPVLVSTAINDAHASTDATLRDMAARAAFRETSNVVMELSASASPEMRDRYMKSAAQGGPTLRIDKYDWRTGMVDVWNGKAQISGSAFTFNAVYCRGTLNATEGTWEYEGVVTCSNGPNSQFMDKVRMRIR